MKHQFSFQDLLTFLQTVALDLPSEKQKKLENYYNELVIYAQKHRIVSRNDISFIVERHLFSSFYFVAELKKSIQKKEEILDLGSGAGFPAIILSLFFDQNHTTMIDSIRKKTLFLSKVVSLNNLNASVVNTRLEDFIKQGNQGFQIITARALADLDTLIKWTYPMLKRGAELHTIKGADYQKELKTYDNLEITANPFEPTWVKKSEYLINKMYIRLRLKDV